MASCSSRIVKIYYDQSVTDTYCAQCAVIDQEMNVIAFRYILLLQPRGPGHFPLETLIKSELGIK
jgi:hypothetical protein